MSRWRAMAWDLLTKPLKPPVTPRTNRLSRRINHEVFIYMGDDNLVFVQHLAMHGKGDPAVAIRMCWEAMQHLAQAAGVGISLPEYAAVPVQIHPLPAPTELPQNDTVTVPATGQNGHR